MSESIRSAVFFIHYFHESIFVVSDYQMCTFMISPSSIHKINNVQLIQTVLFLLFLLVNCFLTTPGLNNDIQCHERLLTLLTTCRSPNWTHRTVSLVMAILIFQHRCAEVLVGDHAYLPPTIERKLNVSITPQLYK